MEKTDILLELEYSEANLSVDIQQLDYILDNFNINNVYKKCFDVVKIRHSLETLLKSMMFNRNNMKKAIEQVHEDNNTKNKKWQAGDEKVTKVKII